ncbi:type II secretion system F family protein [Vibrio sp. 99-8-1]|uniref:type II secretion system F family protein n=1 Tax=Vibrio sp. 99-8-1 TaxID=2607602 RepID=UPI0014933EB7|nr:type II secretion system F family protein [Vibrio sp. 99-8-1]NOI67414.1 type II secretion system F family protein [Vibrio sp. 99-8-1]
MIYLSVTLLTLAMVLIVVANLSSFKRDVVSRRLMSISHYTYRNRSWLSSWKLKGNKSRRRKLTLIGWQQPNAEALFVVFRYLLMTSAGLAWYVSNIDTFTPFSLAECIVMAMVSGILIDRLLDWRVNQVRAEISRVTPDAVDLMVVCVASGLTLEAVFRCVGEEMRPISAALSREWLVTATEIAVLDSPQQALVNLDERVQLPDIKNLVTTMNQALQFGTPIAQALNLIASDSRQYHLLELEEWAGKIPAKMSLPLVVLIMVPVVVMMVAPTMLSLFKTLGSL